MHNRSTLTNRTANFLGACAVCAALLGAAVPAAAQARWDGEGADAGWLTYENWVGDWIPNWGPNTDVTVGSGFGSGQVLDLEGNRRLGTLNVDSETDFTIAGRKRLILHDGLHRSADSDGNQEISSDVAIRNSTFRNDSENGEMNISGQIRGRGGLTVEGAGVLGLEGGQANRYGGKTFIREGGLALLKPESITAIPGNVILGDGEGIDRLGILTGDQLADDAKVIVNASGQFLNFDQFEEFKRLLIYDGLVSVGTGTVNVFKPLRMTGGQISMEGDGLFQTVDRIITNRSDTTASIVGGQLSILGERPVFKVADGEAEIDLGISSRVFSDFGIIKTKKGVMEFSTTFGNDYSGLTLIRKGALRLSEAATPGNTSVGTEVRPGGALELSGVTIEEESLKLRGKGADKSGALRAVAGENQWAGLIDLAGGAGIGVDEGSELLLTGVIDGGSLKKYGEGELILGGPILPEFGGRTFVYEGTLTLDKSEGLNAILGNLYVGDGIGDDRVELLVSGQIDARSNVYVNSSGTFLLSGSASNDVRSLQIDRGSVSVGSGRLKVARKLTMRAGNASIGADGTLALRGKLKTRSATDAAIIAGGTVDLGGRDRKFHIADGDAATDMVVTSGIVNGGVVKKGSGTLVLTGDNDFRGDTSVGSGTLDISGSMNENSRINVDRGGTLVVNGEAPLANTIELASGSRVGGGGNIASTLTITDGATLAPGNSPDTLHVENLELLAGSLLEFELATPGLDPTDPAYVHGINDLITVGTAGEAGTGDLTLDGTLDVIALDGFGHGSYTLMTYTGTLTDNGLSFGDMPPGHGYSLSFIVPHEIDDGGETVFVPGQVVLNAAPEPGTALLVLLGAGGLVARRRRRR